MNIQRIPINQDQLQICGLFFQDPIKIRKLKKFRILFYINIDKFDIILLFIKIKDLVQLILSYNINFFECIYVSYYYFDNNILNRIILFKDFDYSFLYSGLLYLKSNSNSKSIFKLSSYNKKLNINLKNNKWRSKITLLTLNLDTIDSAIFIDNITKKNDNNIFILVDKDMSTKVVLQKISESMEYLIKNRNLPSNIIRNFLLKKNLIYKEYEKINMHGTYYITFCIDITNLDVIIKFYNTHELFALKKKINCIKKCITKLNKMKLIKYNYYFLYELLNRPKEFATSSQ
jgi:hypothetical protein